MRSPGIMRSLFCFLFLPSVAAWSKEIFVSPNGDDSQSCGKRDEPCKSIDQAFSVALNGAGANSTLINAASGNYTLTKSFNFTSVDTFALVGEHSRASEVKITCDPDVSLSFVLCQNIALEGIKFQRCGGWRESTVGVNKSAPSGQGNQGVKFKTALDFRYCRNARFTEIEVSVSPGLGMNFFDVGGVVNFTNCVLADNRAVKNRSTNGSLQSFIEEGYVFSGGGIYMILNKYGDNVVNVTPSQHDSFQHNNTFIFTNCYFLRNEAFGSNVSHKYDLIDAPGPSQFTQGGGLAINFRGNASNCSINIQFCAFSGNRAIWGGGLQIETRDLVKNNHFTINNTTFHNNTGKLAGGGVRIGNLLQRGAADPLNTFTFDKNCSFVSNSAIWGGGMSLYGTYVLSSATKTQFMFNQCIWRDNKGTVGAGLGVMLASKQEVQIASGIPYSISFKNCMFSSNQVVILDQGVMIGEGALYSDQVTLIFEGKTLFINNTNTALSLDGSVTKISNQVDFINNKGYRGGAVAMRGYSKMIFQRNSKLFFYNNSCEHKGGALYIEAAGSPLVAFNATGVNIQDCFFGYVDKRTDFNKWETSVIFQGNRAVDDAKGNSVYATTLKNCRRPGESRQHNTVLEWKFIQFKTLDGNDTSRKDEVATDAVDIHFDRKDWEVAPGEVFDATVKLMDEIGNSIIGIVDVDIVVPENAPQVKLRTASTVFLANGQISHLSLAGKPENVFSVVLRYMARELLVDKINDVSLQSCHAGFVPDESTCVCMNSPGIARCDTDGKTVYLKEGYWGGKVDSKFATQLCPDGYCTTIKSIFPGQYQYISGEVCKDGRNQTSVLCGQCKSGYTILFGSEKCSSDCSNRWLWTFVFLAFIPLTCFVVLVNPNLSSGHLNACLYSYQIMKILTPEGFTFDPFIEFLTALSNIQLGIGRGICFAPGLSIADKLAISALFPVFEIFIVLPLLKCALLRTWGRGLNSLRNRLVNSQRCQGACCCRNAVVTWLEVCSESFRRRVEHGFDHAYCTIVVLCYVDITHIALRLLHFVSVGERRVLFDDGNVEFFDNVKHGIYMIGAIVLLMFVIFIPLRLVILPDRSNLRLETLHACFKPRFRSFVAYYLVCRLVLLLISTYMLTGPLKTSLLQFCCILFLFVIATVRPYGERNRGVEDVRRPANQGGNEAEERHREVYPSTSEAGGSQQVEDHGTRSNGTQEAQRVVNEGHNEEGNNAERVAGQEMVENHWINESDLVILMTLSAIAVFSSPTNTNVSYSIRYGLLVFVRILAYVPLVMAFPPYIVRYIQRRQRERRDHHVPIQQGVHHVPGQQEVPTEPHSHSIERASRPSSPGQLDTSGPQGESERLPLLEDDNNGTRFYTASDDDNTRYSTALQSVVG